jgi:hypothetical protein
LTALLFTFSVTASFAASGIAPTPLRFVPVVLMAALCCDLLVSAIPPAFGTALSAVLAVVCVSSLDDALRHASRRASNVDVVAQAISDQAEAEDLVVLRSWSSAISFARYYKGRAPFVTIPDLPDHQIHRYDLLIEKFRQSDRTEDVMRGVERTFSSGHKVYLVGHFRPVPLEPIVPELPPAPHPRFGYFKVPYLWNSEDRVFQHVLRRATSLSLIPLPTHHTVSARENLPLRVARGALSESAKP